MKDAEWWQISQWTVMNAAGEVGELAKTAGHFAPTSRRPTRRYGSRNGGPTSDFYFETVFSHFFPWLVHQYRPIDHDRPNCWSFQGHGYHHQLNFNGKIMMNQWILDSPFDLYPIQMLPILRRSSKRVHPLKCHARMGQNVSELT